MPGLTEGLSANRTVSWPPNMKRIADWMNKVHQRRQEVFRLPVQMVAGPYVNWYQSPHYFSNYIPFSFVEADRWPAVSDEILCETNTRCPS